MILLFRKSIHVILHNFILHNLITKKTNIFCVNGKNVLDIKKFSFNKLTNVIS